MEMGVKELIANPVGTPSRKAASATTPVGKHPYVSLNAVVSQLRVIAARDREGCISLGFLAQACRSSDLDQDFDRFPAAERFEAMFDRLRERDMFDP